MCRDKIVKPIIVCNSLQVRFLKRNENKTLSRQLITEGQSNGQPGSLANKST